MADTTPDLTAAELDGLASLIPRDLGEILEGKEPDKNSRYLAAVMDPATIRTLVAMARRCSSLEETVKVLSDPKAMELLRQGEADLAAGRLIDHEEVRRLIDDKHQRRMRNDNAD